METQSMCFFMFYRFIDVVLIFLIADWYSIVWISHILLICSPADGHWIFPQYLPVFNNDTLHIFIHDF